MAAWCGTGSVSSMPHLDCLQQYPAAASLAVLLASTFGCHETRGTSAAEDLPGLEQMCRP